MSDKAQKIWDQKLANDGAMADNCMKLGAVILKPASKPPVGFAPEPGGDDDPS